MTKTRMTDYAAWGLLIGGYIYASAFITLLADKLTPAAPDYHQTVMLFALSLFAIVAGIAATRPKRVWFSAPLLLLIALLVLDLVLNLNNPFCGEGQGSICVIST